MGDLLTFKAGKVRYDETTKRATPLAGKGLVTVAHHEEDATFVSLVWERRGPGAVDSHDGSEETEREELLLFPGDAQWVHCKKCTTGRVFALKFKSSGDRLLFWLQEDNGQAEPGTLSAADNEISAVLNSLLNVLEENDGNDIVMEDKTGENTAALEDTLSTTNTGISIPILSITDALPISSFVAHIRSLPEQALKPYYDLMPETFEHTRENLIKVIQTPQFFSSVDTLSSVFRDSAGIGSLVASQLGYPYQGEGIEGFLNGARESGLRESENDRVAKDQEDVMEE
ncbi:hypothetical protein NADFUDRAFT_27645 [Nadsonia fulvescens var. elongata DSM 6958]|uniref:Pru domain-containing protein n=1 Tax=Nadsonia fulvescens var. elongata DSM 6958 TaxID=857566 RepID=A0A1E3PFZ0_9ASCO|nr:hypothetical protein NADFUDRAFT_27645 [Nadsonia fulvescens var. elongata DSM 6958]